MPSSDVDVLDAEVAADGCFRVMNLGVLDCVTSGTLGQPSPRSRLISNADRGSLTRLLSDRIKSH